MHCMFTVFASLTENLILINNDWKKNNMKVSLYLSFIQFKILFIDESYLIGIIKTNI